MSLRRLGGGKLTHPFPGFHYGVVRPLRDDLRRTIVETPRRAVRRTGKTRQRQERAVGKRVNKMLVKDTHKGRTSKTTAQQQQQSRAPKTMKAQQPGYKVLKIARTKPPPVLKDTGVKIHKPRLLSPHHPYLYHVVPVSRVAQLNRKYG